MRKCIPRDWNENKMLLKHLVKVKKKERSAGDAPSNLTIRINIHSYSDGLHQNQMHILFTETGDKRVLIRPKWWHVAVEKCMLFLIVIMQKNVNLIVIMSASLSIASWYVPVCIMRINLSIIHSNWSYVVLHSFQNKVQGCEKQADAHYKQQEHVEGTDGTAGKEEFKQEEMRRSDADWESLHKQIHNMLVGKISVQCTNTNTDVVRQMLSTYAYIRHLYSRLIILKNCLPSLLNKNFPQRDGRSRIWTITSH